MDLDQLATLLKMLKESDVSEFKYRDEDMQLRLRIGPPPARFVGAAPVAAAAPAPVAAAAIEAPSAPAAAPPAAAGTSVDSPMVGTLYVSPSPGAPPFVEIGQRVTVGQTLCIIEAMKLMNQIEAEVAGVVVARHVGDGQPVEFGQPIFTIRPD